MCTTHQQTGDDPTIDDISQLGQVLLHFVDEPLVNFVEPKAALHRLGHKTKLGRQRILGCVSIQTARHQAAKNNRDHRSKQDQWIGRMQIKITGKHRRHREDQQRQCHHGRTFLCVLSVIGTRLAAKRNEEKACHVKRRQHRNRNRNHKQRHALLECHGQNRFLAEKSTKQWHTTKRQGPDQKCPVRLRHPAAQPSHFPNVLFMVTGVNHRACPKEKHRLEKRVRRQVKHRCIRSSEVRNCVFFSIGLSSQPHPHHHVA